MYMSPWETPSQHSESPEQLRTKCSGEPFPGRWTCCLLLTSALMFHFRHFCTDASQILSSHRVRWTSRDHGDWKTPENAACRSHLESKNRSCSFVHSSVFCLLFRTTSPWSLQKTSGYETLWHRTFSLSFPSALPEFTVLPKHEPEVDEQFRLYPISN